MLWAVTTEFILSVLINGVIAGLSIWAILDCARQSADRFRVFGKLSKGAWLGILGASILITGLAFLTGLNALTGIGFGVALFGGGGGFGTILTLACAVAAGVYLAGVRPSLSGKNDYGYF